MNEYNIIKNGIVLATAETEKKAWKLLGASTKPQREELIAIGFSVLAPIPDGMFDLTQEDMENLPILGEIPLTSEPESSTVTLVS